MTKKVMAMLDLETLGAEPAGVAITSVGLVMFTVDEIIDTAYWRLDPRWTPGLRTKDTYEWWDKQDRGAYEEMMRGTALPWDFCEQFSGALSLYDVEYIWSYPSRFDLGHIRELYHTVGHQWPLSFRIERDMTTLLWMARLMAPGIDDRIQEIRARNPQKHNAMEDARNQAEIVQMVLRYFEIDPLAGLPRPAR